MQLEVSAWTRRERVERIAAAERDRRAGRETLALAALGEASEWPARLVVALAKLPEGEGAETRALLESTLDDWAAENGLSLEDPAPPVDADLEGDPPALDPYLAADRRAAALDAPIDFDELEQAFAAAEVDPDEMLDVNTVAERVLRAEPLDVDGLDEDGETSAADRPVLDAAFAEAPIWPEPVDPAFDAAPFEPEAPDFSSWGRQEGVATETRRASEAAPDHEPPVADRPSRPAVLATLERWLANLENQRRRRAR